MDHSLFIICQKRDEKSDKNDESEGMRKESTIQGKDGLSGNLGMHFLVRTSSKMNL